ncbi:hypothetical protein LCGC14_0988600 [marine sediment metagenome]|uniref:Uncharacterized protein n=1 Tax=marine sediment metagenome TaxID=412755 RepID=A0A0F9QPT0_9ZZZZ
MECTNWKENNQTVYGENIKGIQSSRRCRLCGGARLWEDPSMYYCHAFSEDGRSFLCLDCTRK